MTSIWFLIHTIYVLFLDGNKYNFIVTTQQDGSYKNDMISAALLAHYLSAKPLNPAVNSTWLDTKISVCYTVYLGGRDGSVSIASRYGLDGTGIESRLGGKDFPHPYRPLLGPTGPPIQWVPGFHGDKAAGAWR